MYYVFTDYIDYLDRNCTAYKDSVEAMQYADSAQARSWDQKSQRTYLTNIAVALDDIYTDFGSDGLEQAMDYVREKIRNIDRLLSLHRYQEGTN
jgi:hypothetical protein